MTVILNSPIGLVAGSGRFPIEFAESARRRGLDVVVCAHEGETDPTITESASQCTWVRVGQLGKIIRTLRHAGVREVAFVGGISRVKLFGGIQLDLRGLQMLARIRSVRDDAILRGIATEIESSGMRVISPASVLEKSIAREGVLTKRAFSAEELSNAVTGWEIAKRIGGADIGQTIIMNAGLVVAVEAVEGTDATIRRAGALSGKGSVVIKVGKPMQDNRLDIPAIGTQTIETMAAAGATALVLENEMALLVDPATVVREANRLGIAITVWVNPSQSSGIVVDSMKSRLK